MELPKIVFDDFYKFLMSCGIILFLVGIGTGTYMFLSNVLTPNTITQSIIFFRWVTFVLYLVVSGIGIWMICFAGKKWYENQKQIDEKLKADTQIARQTASNMLLPKDNVKEVKTVEQNITSDSVIKSSVALVDYKIASVLPNSVAFDFLKEWKVWFLINNHEAKKYNAYVKITFICEQHKIELNEGYYGGTQAWHLNALSGIQAPGLGIPEEIKKNVKKHKKIEIRINCEIKDENDTLIEKKLPIGYVYDYQNNNWYLEP